MDDWSIYADIYAGLRKKCCVDVRPGQANLRIYAAFQPYADIYAGLRTDFVLPGRTPPWQGRGWAPPWRATHHAPRRARGHFGSIYASTRQQPQVEQENPMTKLCLRCGEHPVADEEPPHFPFCESCWLVVTSQGNYFVDEDGNFDCFMRGRDR